MMRNFLMASAFIFALLALGNVAQACDGYSSDDCGPYNSEGSKEATGTRDFDHPAAADSSSEVGTDQQEESATDQN